MKPKTSAPHLHHLHLLEQFARFHAFDRQKNIVASGLATMFLGLENYPMLTE